MARDLTMPIRPDTMPEPAAPRSRADERARLADSLVERAKAGDKRAFDALVRRFRPRIYALALHVSGSASDADDITQDAFVKAYRHLPTFEGRSAFFTWLYRITLHGALNVQRTKRQPASCLPEEDARVEAALRVDAAGDPRAALELREAYTVLVHALDQLSPTLKSAVVLTALSGLSAEEAAVVLGTSPGAVAVRLHEARKRLRASMERHERGEVVRPAVPAADSRKGRRAQHERWSLSGLSLDLVHALRTLL
jgi:RNA polymerase sigma-70 factor (ECF subfamily)